MFGPLEEEGAVEGEGEDGEDAGVDDFVVLEEGVGGEVGGGLAGHGVDEGGR